MFEVIDKFKSWQLHNFFRHSLGLLRYAKRTIINTMTAERTIMHEALDVALVNSGVKQASEEDLFV
jgi:hypothetical protein